MADEPKIHKNTGGLNGWKTACGKESHSFSNRWSEVDCAACLRSAPIVSFKRIKSRGDLARYAVYSATEKIGEVRKVEIDKNPWSDRPPVVKWAGFLSDGDMVKIAATRAEAADYLVSR
jgi:hypothetical protein